MYRYKYNRSYHHKSRKARRSVIMAVVFVTVVLSGAGYIAYDVARQTMNKSATVSQASYSSVQGTSINLFRTQYFQFQADDSWKEVAAESRDGHYVYRSMKGTLVTRDITIDVNNTKPESVALLRTNHIMPVTIDASGRLLPQGGAGDHCKTAMPKGAPVVPTPVTQRQVRFVCTPDSVLYQVAVGVVGGSTNMQLTRNDGTKAVYTITFRDLTVESTDAPLRSILTSFQAL